MVQLNIKEKFEEGNFIKQHDWYSKIQYQYKDAETGIISKKYLSRTSIDILSFLVTQVTLLNKNKIEKQVSKEKENEVYYYTTSVEYIAERLNCSRYTVNRTCNILIKLGLIKKYRSIQTTKWLVCIDELNKLYNQIISNPEQLTEKEKITNEINNNIDDTIDLTQDLAIEQEKEANETVVNNITAISDIIPIAEQNEMISDELNKHSQQIENIYTIANDNIEHLTKAKREIFDTVKNNKSNFWVTKYGYSTDEYYNQQINSLKTVFSNLNKINSLLDFAYMFVSDHRLNNENWYCDYVKGIYQILLENNILTKQN